MNTNQFKMGNAIFVDGVQKTAQPDHMFVQHGSGDGIEARRRVGTEGGSYQGPRQGSQMGNIGRGHFRGSGRRGGGRARGGGAGRGRGQGRRSCGGGDGHVPSQGGGIGGHGGDGRGGRFGSGNSGQRGGGGIGGHGRGGDGRRNRFGSGSSGQRGGGSIGRRLCYRCKNKGHQAQDCPSVAADRICPPPPPNSLEQVNLDRQYLLQYQALLEDRFHLQVQAPPVHANAGEPAETAADPSEDLISFGIPMDEN